MVPAFVSLLHVVFLPAVLGQSVLCEGALIGTLSRVCLAKAARRCSEASPSGRLVAGTRTRHACADLLLRTAPGGFASDPAQGRTPETQAFLDYLATVANQVKGPAEVFDKLATWAITAKLNAE